MSSISRETENKGTGRCRTYCRYAEYEIRESLVLVSKGGARACMWCLTEGEGVEHRVLPRRHVRHFGVLPRPHVRIFVVDIVYAAEDLQK